MLAFFITWAVYCVSTQTVTCDLATGSSPGGDRQSDGLSTAPSLRRLLQDIRGDAKVYDGEPAPEGRFPYACSLQVPGLREHGCGGTLIAPRWVLTAAHCVTGRGSLGPTPVVHVGAHNIGDESSTEVILAVEAIIHERYIPGDIENGFDIALLRLRKASTKQPVALAQSGQRLGRGQLLVSAGWGKTSDRGPLPEVLQFVDRLEYVTNRNCQRTWGRLTDSMLCTQSSTQGTCRGDSGGPLLIGDSKRGGGVKDGNLRFDIQVGIVSFGQAGCGSTSPEVFTRISSFRRWIDENIGSRGQGPNPSPPKEDPKEDPVAAGVICEYTIGIDYFGNDIINMPFNINSHPECCALCKRTPGCNGWLWRRDFNHCWLKRVMINPQPCPNCIAMKI